MINETVKYCADTCVMLLVLWQLALVIRENIVISRSK